MIKERMCVVCRQHYDQSQMIRIARVNGLFTLDNSKKGNGRGAYVCLNCRQNVGKKKSLNKSFKQPVPEEIYKQIEEYEQNS